MTRQHTQYRVLYFVKIDAMKMFKYHSAICWQFIYIRIYRFWLIYIKIWQNRMSLCMIMILQKMKLCSFSDSHGTSISVSLMRVAAFWFNITSENSHYYYQL